MNIENITWHKEILPKSSESVLNDLDRVISLSPFYLAGGTGLALKRGHRFSRDFDFFSTKLFDEELLLQKMQGLKNLTIVSKSTTTLHIVLNKINVSFLGYLYPLLFPKMEYRTKAGVIIEVADERDIACMKISAISGRGTRRDFIDLYMVARLYGLKELFELFQKKFSLTPYNNIHVLKSLVYFDDAEREPLPDMRIPLAWETVKRFLTVEVPRLL
jgi:hypothetical protein